MCSWNSQSHEYIDSQDTINAKNGCDRKIAVDVDIAGQKIALVCSPYYIYILYGRYFFVGLSWQFRNVPKQILKHRHRTVVSLVVPLNK